MKNIYGLIRRLGANSKYKGYFFTAEAVKISMGYQYKPLRITKDIYPCLARKYKSMPTNVEHDIRTLVNVCWEGNRRLLDEIAGYQLEDKPTNSEFIDMLAYYLREMEETSWLQFFENYLVLSQKVKNHIIPELLWAFIHRECFKRGSGSTKKAVIFKLKI